jgi:hypothetical protein
MTPRLRAHALATFQGRALPIQRLRPKAS